MAKPILLEIPPRNPRAELQTRLANAPLEHAEALLSAYEVLEGLHEKGVFELLRGALGAGDQVVETIVDGMNTPESVRGLRNLVILAKLLGGIEPSLLEGFARSLPEAIARTKAHAEEPPSFWEILKKFQNINFRRGLLLVNSLLEAFGKNLTPAKPVSRQQSN